MALCPSSTPTTCATAVLVRQAIIATKASMGKSMPPKTMKITISTAVIIVHLRFRTFGVDGPVKDAVTNMPNFQKVFKGLFSRSRKLRLRGGESVRYPASEGALPQAAGQLRDVLVV